MKTKILSSIAVIALSLIITTSNTFAQQSSSVDVKSTGKAKVEKQANPASTAVPKCCDESKKNASQCTEKEKAVCREIQKNQEKKELKVERKAKKINKK